MRRTGRRRRARRWPPRSLVNTIGGILVAVFAREVTFRAACHSSRQRRGRRRESGAHGRTCRLCDLCGGSVSWGRVSCAGGVAVPRLASLELHGVRLGAERLPAATSRLRPGPGHAPKMILTDEPASMLDVSIRIGLLNLMATLRDSEGV